MESLYNSLYMWCPYITIYMWSPYITIYMWCPYITLYTHCVGVWCLEGGVQHWMCVEGQSGSEVDGSEVDGWVPPLVCSVDIIVCRSATNQLHLLEGALFEWSSSVQELGTWSVYYQSSRALQQVSHHNKYSIITWIPWIFLIFWFSESLCVSIHNLVGP